MPFFDKLTKNFENLLSDDKKKEKTETHGDDDKHRGFEQPGSQQQFSSPQGQYGGPPHQDSSYYGTAPTGQYGAPPAGQYGAPPAGQYGAPPSSNPGAYQASQYGGAASHPGQYGGATLPPTPTVPSGWSALWDPTGQRWAYLELSNNQVIWNFPTFPSLAQHGGDHGTRGFDDGHGHGFQGGAYGGGHDQYGGGAHGGHDDSLEKKKKDDKKKLIAGAAAGVAAGAVGGAVLAEALDSDDEHHGGAAHGGYASGGTYVPPGQYNQLQEPLPDETHDGSSVSSSDKEDVEEAKEDYEEALKSGDKEDIEEAREEYQEEYEETYEDD